MATRIKIRESKELRQLRTFSKDFKIKKVRELEQRITTVSEISKQYEVSCTSVYRWLNLYGKDYMKATKVIVEAQSDTRKIVDLKAKIAELELIVGQKQVQLEFKDKMIDLAEETYGVDIKKKFSSPL
jgi:transposase-like protein